MQQNPMYSTYNLTKKYCMIEQNFNFDFTRRKWKSNNDQLRSFLINVEMKKKIAHVSFWHQKLKKEEKCSSLEHFYPFDIMNWKTKIRNKNGKIEKSLFKGEQ